MEIKVYIDFLKYKKHKKSRHFNISFHMKTKKNCFSSLFKINCQLTDINNLPLNYQFYPFQVKQINKCLFATFYEVYSRLRIIESGDFRRWNSNDIKINLSSVLAPGSMFKRMQHILHSTLDDGSDCLIKCTGCKARSLNRYDLAYPAPM